MERKFDTVNGPYRVYRDDTDGDELWYFEPCDYDGDVKWSLGAKTSKDAIFGARVDAEMQANQRASCAFFEDEPDHAGTSDPDRWGD